MNSTDMGRLGEIKALAKLVEFGWYPFTDISGKCPVDIIAWKDGLVKSFQVKSTDSFSKSGKPMVQVGTCRPNRTTTIVKSFDKDSADYLIVYVKSTDKVYFIPSEDVTAGRGLTIQDKHDIFLVI